jgi:hypothetical protein
MSSPATGSRVGSIVHTSLPDAHDCEHERMLVAGVVVLRRGDHYAIADGPEDPTRLARLAAGLCDCGASLSVRDGRRHCRTCYREFLC